MPPVLEIAADANLPFAREIFAPFGNVTIIPTGSFSRESLLSSDVLVVRSETPISASLLEGTPVRFVGTATIGMDHVDRDYLASREIGFSSAPGCNSTSVAEYVASAILETESMLDVSFAGKTLGVIGVGNVGAKVVRVGEALGLRVLCNDPPRARKEGGSGFVSLREALSCDIVSLHVPLEKQGDDPTFHMISEREFSSMRNGVVFINSSRGAVVETGTLVDAVRRGTIAAAVIDVWEGEPSFNPDLLSLVQIATPHIAGYALDGKVRAVTMIADAVKRHFQIEGRVPSIAELPLPGAGDALRSIAGDGRDTVRRVVRAGYDIRRDDIALKAACDLPRDEQSKLFRRLRREYPVRREFPRQQSLPTEVGGEAREILERLGFRAATAERLHSSSVLS